MSSTAQILPFQFDTHEVRTLLIDNQPWFVAADLCAALSIVNPRRALTRLDEDEKGVHSMNTLGGTQNLSIVNESGLYSLILTSRKPEAKRFKKWVTAEVLPSIRQHGHYQDAERKMGTLVDKTIGTDGFHVLSGLVDSRVRHLPKGIKASVRSRLWSQVHIAYNVKAANEIPADQFDSVRQFVASAAIEGDYIAATRNEPAVVSQIDLPLSTGRSFENIPNSHLFGGDLIYHSCLSALFAQLREAARDGNAVRVRELSGAWEEVRALRSRLETVLRRHGEQKMMIADLQQHLGNANRVAERLR